MSSADDSKTATHPLSLEGNGEPPPTTYSLCLKLVLNKAATESSADQAPQSIKGISGIWFNELGSRLEVRALPDGSVAGSYTSAVGNAQDFYVLAGRFDAVPPSGRGISIGWTVSWRNQFRNAHDTTTWSGQYFDGPQPAIITQWLLTRSTTPGNVWDSTTIGNDRFTRTRPSLALDTANPLPTYASNFPPTYDGDE